MKEGVHKLNYQGRCKLHNKTMERTVTIQEGM